MEIVVGPVCQIRRARRARASSYPPEIWAIYEGCRSTWTYMTVLKSPAGSRFCDRRRLRSPAIDALSEMRYVLDDVHCMYGVVCSYVPCKELTGATQPPEPEKDEEAAGSVSLAPHELVDYLQRDCRRHV